MMKKKIHKNLDYEVIAYRYGDKEEGYVVGHVYDEMTAQKLAEYEEELRGGKYKVEFRRIK